MHPQILLTRLKIDDWVNQGRSHVKGNSICPFCQQKTITEDFKTQLEGYFDETYTASIKTAHELTEKYSNQTNDLTRKLTEINETQKNNRETKLDLALFSSYLNTFLAQVEANKILISEKVKEPSNKIELAPTKEILVKLNDLIKKANIKI